MAELPADSLLGTSLAHFRIEARLGAGGMGVVYRALDTRLKRQVALKVLPPELSSDGQRRALLLREARSAAAINHPNLAAIYEIGEHEGRTFIAMELVSGRNLRHLLVHGPLPLELALAIGSQVAQALQRAHGAGLIHRDLKPDNLMVGDDGTVKLLDFGLAKRTDFNQALADTGAPVSHESMVMGTPGYMAPEQTLGTTIDHRADLFAFGALLYEMLTGKRAFLGTTTMELIIATARDPAPPVQQLRPEVPDAVANVIAQLLEKEPDKRPASAAAVSAVLGSYGPVSPAHGINSNAPTVPVVGSTRVVRRRGRRWPFVVAAGVLTGVGAAALFWWWQRPVPITDHRTPPGTPEAQQAYRMGLQSLRAGSASSAYESFKHAAELDPSMGSAHLRLALLDSGNYGAANWDGVHKQNVSNARRESARLDAREQALLGIAEGVRHFGAEPDTVAKAQAAADRFPRDVEVRLYLAKVLARTGRRSDALVELDHVLALDPEFAGAELEKSVVHVQLGDEPAQLDDLERCLKINPAARNCLVAVNLLHVQLGQCDKFEADSRTLTGLEPTDPAASDALACALVANDAPLAGVKVALDRAAALTPAREARQQQEHFNTLRLSLVEGDFVTAERALGDIEHDRAGRVATIDHSGPAYTLMRTLEEAGEDERALAVAEDFIARAPGWRRDYPLVEVHRLALLRKLHRISAEAYADEAARLRSWVEEKIPTTIAAPDRNSKIWVMLHRTAVTETVEQAQADLVGAPEHTPYSQRIYAAMLLADAGRYEEALPRLRELAGGCWMMEPLSEWWDGTLSYMQVKVALGRALEATGDRAGACVPYAFVRHHWKTAKPRSLSLETATERSKALGCPD